jgi:hypothetical protein
MTEPQATAGWRRPHPADPARGGRGARPAQFDSVVEGARSAARAALAPTWEDLEALLITMHRESGENQARARRVRDEARQALKGRLKGVPVEHNGQTVMVSTVRTRHVIAALEAECDVIKAEAMAQRSYEVHARLVSGLHRLNRTSIEDFIASQG